MPAPLFDWRTVREDPPHARAGDGFRVRARLGLAITLGALAIVFSRLLTFAATEAADFRAVAARPLERASPLTASRGRILDRHGAVLAEDEPLVTIEMHYRHFESPPQASWLKRRARDRLSGPAKRDPAKLADATAAVTKDLESVQASLADLAGISPEAWETRRSRVQREVERIRESVRRRQAERFATAVEEREARAEERAAGATSWHEEFAGFVEEVLAGPAETRPREHLVVAEELAYHTLVDDVPLHVAAEVEAHPERYPGVRIGQATRRHYPSGSLAAHVVGHVARPTTEDLAAESEASSGQSPVSWIGRMGIEASGESLLRGRDGLLVELTDRRGHVEGRERRREPQPGRDITLTLDAALQRTAEQLVDSAVARRAGRQGPSGASAGGAAVVIDIRTGAILAAASAPRFDPGAFAEGDNQQLQAILAAPDRPLFDRAARMAIPPGSVFKVLTGIAALESDIDPQAAVECLGYLEHPDRLRCALYRHTGQGHGETDLSAAIMQSCNVYFFTLAGKLGPTPLVEWSRQFGLGERSGLDWPGESSGQVPSPESLRGTRRSWKLADTQAMSIGQGELLTTPVQIARLMAAVANGGKLVEPHGVKQVATPASTIDPDNGPADDAEEVFVRRHASREIADLHPETLATLRAAMLRVVDDPLGTAHSTVYLEELPIAGKTGTAEVGPGKADHAWFAGYAPADAPRVAFAVAIEHGGDGGEVAGPVARRLVQRMLQLGYFPRPTR